MPDSIWGVAFYVFALFPGLAFTFGREGHQPTAKRTVLRETAGIVFVSALCDAVLALVLALLSLVPAFGEELRHLIRGDLDWPRQNPALAALCVVAAITFTTLLGRLLGSEWAHSHGLSRIYQSSVPRDTSAWSAAFATDIAKGNVVELGVQLKSGSWIGGTLNKFDNDPEPVPTRALTLTNAFTRDDSSGTFTPLGDWVIVEAGEIEYLQITYAAPTPESDS